MLKPTTKNILLACLMGAGATVSIAQTGAASTAGGQPTGVGVSPQTAAEANRKAVPRSDTATVVRTGPDAGDRARQAADATRNAAGNAADATRNAASRATTATRNAAGNAADATRDAVTPNSTNNSATGGSGSGSDTSSSSGRPARSDRN